MENVNPKIGLQKGSRTGTLVGILLILISLAVYSFFTTDLRDQMAANAESIESTQLELDSIKASIAAVEEAQSELDLSTEVQRTQVERKIPNELAQDEVIEDLVEITDDNRIALRSLSFGQGVSSDSQVASLRINASFEGDYNDLVTFLRAVETNSRFFRVNSISVQLNRTDITGVKRATFSLSMEAFFKQID